VQPGSRVFITRRAGLSDAAGCPAAGTSAFPGSRIRIDLAFRIGEGGRPVLAGSVHRAGVRIALIRRAADFAVEPARAQELAETDIRKILSKRGDAPYLIGDVSVDWPPGTYARKGDIGGLRRDLLSDIGKYLIAGGRPGPGEAARAEERLGKALAEEGSPTLSSPPGKRTLTLMVLTDTLDGLEGIAGEGSGLIAFEPPGQEEGPGGSQAAGSCGITADMIRDAAAIARDSGWTFIWKWPRITPDPWIEAAGEILRNGEIRCLPGLMAEGPGAALAAAAASPGLTLHGGAGLNVWNARTVGVLSPFFGSLILSPELSHPDLADLVPRARSPGPRPLLGFMVEGNLEVMVSEDRLTGLLPGRPVRHRGRKSLGIRDGTGRVFSVEADACGRTRVLNSVETCLVDQLPALGSLGIDHLVIDARGRGARYAKEMAAIYHAGISLAESGGEGVSRRLGDLREECRVRARGGITHGNFLRGLSEEPEGLS
ncbi:MAG TPA: DUF3656 domain-containing protein, partial [Methanomicrobiales archaeon]|nr:DUF3656 domain-containing protein [Methanomicrobiales archaeon]